MAYYPTSAASYQSAPTGSGSAQNVQGVLVTASGSSNTKGSWVELISAASFDANYVGIWIPALSTGGVSYALDVGTGASGSETVLVPNVSFSGDGTSSCGVDFGVFPCAIASGTRVSGRLQCSTGGDSASVSITLIDAATVPGISTWNTYGVDTSTSLATQIDPGGTIGNKGSWVELTSSTSALTQFVVIMISMANNAPSNARWSIDIGTGGSGSETVLIPDLRMIATASATLLNPNSYQMLTYIPMGTRLSARCSCTITDATDRKIRVAILAGTAPSEPSGGGGAWAFA